jgi:hypothetical protein
MIGFLCCVESIVSRPRHLRHGSSAGAQTPMPWSDVGRTEGDKSLCRDDSYSCVRYVASSGQFSELLPRKGLGAFSQAGGTNSRFASHPALEPEPVMNAVGLHAG